MATVQLHPAIPDLVQQLAREPTVQRVLLFGSRARGTARERSDIDLAVDAPGASEQEWARIAIAVDEAETLLRIDLVRLDEASGDFREEIEREGMILFAR